MYLAEMMGATYRKNIYLQQYKLTIATISAAVPLEHLIIGTAPILTTDVINHFSF